MADTSIDLNAKDTRSLPVKLVDEGDGTYSIKISGGSSALPTGASTAARQDTGNTSLAAINTDTTAAAASLTVLDDWDESDRAKVNVIVGQAGITAGAGAVAANTPRQTLASDDPAVTALQIMDDWDESDRAKVNLVVGQAGVTAGAGAVAANTPRVTVASDDPLVTRLGEVQASPTSNTVLDRLKALLTGTILAAGSAIIGKVGIDQTTPGTTDRVTAGGKTATVDTNFTRPADTTAYAANDAVTNSTSAPTILTFSNCARASGGTGVITDAVLIDESDPGTDGSFDLMLYDTTFTPNNDNAAFNPSTTVQRTFVGKISFSSPIVSGSSSNAYHATGLNIAFTTVASANLFGELVARNAYTPANTGRFDIRLKILQD